MGIETRKEKAPPLPAPTETSETDSTVGNENAEVESRVTEKSTYSLPEDGSPVTIATRKKKNQNKENHSELASNNKSQTSLLIEYFEGGKEDKTRRPSVRVKVTPSSKHRSKSAHDHIQITERKGTRRPSYTQRIQLSPRPREDKPLSPDDENSMSSFRSMTEESNVTSRSGRPVEVEIMRHGSPLIPTEVGSKSGIYNASEISSMPADSFLDGHTRSPERKRSRSLTRSEALVAGAATGLAAGAAADKLRTPSRRRSRSLSRERIVAQKAVEKVRGDRSERRRKHRSRSRSVSGEQLGDALKSPRRRSSRSHVEESMLSGADSSAVSRNSGKYSFQSATSKSSINNPKLLETVEDAIRRLILPELKELKREQSLREPNGGRRISTGSGVSRESKEDVSRPKVVLNDNEVLSGNTIKGRKGKSVSSLPSFERDGSEETVTQEERVQKKRSGEKNRGLEAAAVGAGLGALTAAALEKHQSQEPVDEKKERRRRRKNHSRGNSLGGELREDRDRLDVVPPPMPLMSEINASDITRTSILSAETERPDSAHSASQERFTPVQDVSRGIGSPSSITPTRTPVNLQHGLGTQHSNFSRGNLSLKSQNSDQRVHSQEYELDEQGRKIPMQDHHDPDLDDSFVSEEHNGSHSNNIKTGNTARVLSPALDPDDLEDSELLEDEPLQHQHPYYQNTQEVPPPLRYIPYGHERRGLSPIQSVSGYTENEDQQLDNKRDSKLTQSSASYSSLTKAALHKQSLKSLDSNVNVENRHDFSEVRQGSLSDSELTQENEYWEEQHRENDRNRDLDSESFDGQYDDKRLTNYTDDSLDTRIVSTGQDIKGVGGKPNYVNAPIGVESAVASLVNASEITGTNSYPENGQYDRRGSFASFEDDSERNFTSRGNSPTKSPTKFEDEYDLDENGRKVAKSQTAQKVGGAALGATAAALLARAREKMRNEADQIKYEERMEHTGAPLQKSFKDRTMDGQKLLSPRHSVDALSEASLEKPEMGFSAMPSMHDNMPEVGYGDADSDVTTNPSIIQGPIGGTQQGSREHWSNQATPPQARRTQSSDSTGLKEAEAAVIGAAMGAGAGAALANHNRQHSQDQEDEWRRTSSERKRDTLITNPYEDTSPIAALGNGTGLDREILNQVGLQNASRELNNRLYPGSPLPKDEGYISSAPNARSAGAQTPELQKGKGLGFMDKELGSAAQALGGGDGFYPKHSRHLSGMSEGMDSPLYDSATGNGMDRIQSKDIVALMDHLTVRDAQRSARDTEILVTLVRAAAEMRNSFEDMKRLLADTEDVIITEVQVNTEKSVQKAINGPRPLPPSAPRSIRSQGEMYEDLPTKRRNVFRRALKGLSKRSTNDLGKIEDMLVQLLGDVEGLKVAQGLQVESNYEEYPPEGRSEPDRGYEPEGNAGTSTASHGSQSGHLSIPQSRGPSGKGFEGRKFSDHRISTVPEGDEDEVELDPHEEEILNNQFENNEALLTPTRDRGESVPLDTPPQQFIASGSLSNDNTPRTETEKTKKHKSSSSSGWIPKVSRWSETTASTVFKGFRSSGRNSGRKDAEQFTSPPPRSDSGLGTYNTEQEPEQERAQSRELDRESERTVSRGNYAESEPEDKLHSGFSQEQLHQQFINDEVPASLRPPEDPKYKAHRNSINLQHPQPRPGPTHRYQTHLESQAQNYDQAPMSPSSINWGSSTSLNRLPPNQNRYSQATTNTERNLSPISDGGYSDRSASGQAPARPPKEPIVPEKPLNIRNKLQKPSPLSNEHLSANMQSENSYESSSPQSASRRLSGALGAPTRKPTGPRSMSTASKSGELNRDEGTVIRRNKNRGMLHILS
ncbi:dim2-associated 1 variant 1 protein [Rutstroemia sp. NJR-2017a BVV2]|nr:dim2-associated 1 variant 1 protein [Rutstroemia sp. NJR-2017a BVV2]